MLYPRVLAALSLVAIFPDQRSVGQMVRFGASTRLYLLEGPEDVAQQENIRALELEEEGKDLGVSSVNMHCSS